MIHTDTEPFHDWVYAFSNNIGRIKSYEFYHSYPDYFEMKVQTEESSFLSGANTAYPRVYSFLEKFTCTKRLKKKSRKRTCV